MSVVDPGEITARLLELRRGGDDARERLFASVYEQLKSLARRQLKLGGRTPTLGAQQLAYQTFYMGQGLLQPPSVHEPRSVDAET